MIQLKPRPQTPQSKLEAEIRMRDACALGLSIAAVVCMPAMLIGGYGFFETLVASTLLSILSELTGINSAIRRRGGF